MYRKKPVIVEAFQWFPNAGIHHAGIYCDLDGPDVGNPYVITIHNERAHLNAGDWILAEPDGRSFYPCKPDIFAATYEPAETERLPNVEVAGLTPRLGDYKVGGELRPPDVEAMPPGARADAMRPPDVVMQPIGAAPKVIHEDDYHHPNQRATRFRDEIEQVINSHSRENGSGTPDFVLAQFVLDVMDAFDRAVTRRQSWYGRPTDEKALIKMLDERLQAEGEHTAAGQVEIERLSAENAQLRGELQRVSMAGLTPSMVVGK